MCNWIASRFWGRAFDNFQVDLNEFDNIPHSIVRGRIENGPFPQNVRWIITQMTGIHPDQDLFDIVIEGQLSIEKEKLFCESLEILEKTEIGKTLFREIGRKLLPRQHPQNKVHLILHAQSLASGCCFEINALNQQMEIHLDFHQFAARTFTFLRKEPNGDLGFFEVQYPLSLIIGHEFGHVLQALGAINPNEIITIDDVDNANIQHWNAMLSGMIRHVCKDCNEVRKLRHLSPIRFDFADKSIDWLYPLFTELNTKEHLPNDVKLRYEVLKQTISYIQGAWNRQFMDLPNILPEPRFNRQIQYSDGGLLSEIIRITDQTSFIDYWQRPHFYGTNFIGKRSYMRLKDAERMNLETPNSEFVFARWGHSPPAAWAYMKWHEIPLPVKQCWQKYAKILLESVGINLEKLPQF